MTLTQASQKTPIITFVGFKQSGKSTATQCLSHLNPYEIAFALSLKQACEKHVLRYDVSSKTMVPIPNEFFHDQRYKEKPFIIPVTLTAASIDAILSDYKLVLSEERRIEIIRLHVGVTFTTPRKLLEYVGAELLRSIQDNILIQTALEIAPPEAQVLIVSDCRFPNEFEELKQRGAFMIGIDRKEVTPEDLSNSHASERYIPSLIEKCNVKIYNNDTLENFISQIKETVEQYLLR